MKEIYLLSGDYLLVGVHDDAYDFEIFINGTLFCDTPNKKAMTLAYLKNSFSIISTTNDITEEICKSIVKKGGLLTYKDYTYVSIIRGNGVLNAILQMKFKTAKESLNSLLQSVGLDLDKNYLILKKNL